jgi:hypothetical protein
VGSCKTSFAFFSARFTIVVSVGGATLAAAGVTMLKPKAAATEIAAPRVIRRRFRVTSPEKGRRSRRLNLTEPLLEN